MTLTLQEAKQCVTIESLWHEFGYAGKPGKQCRCPFHEDNSPSFSLFDDGKAWKCFAGCGQGTCIDFLALAAGVSEEAACLEILKRAGGRENGNNRYQKPQPKAPRHDAVKLELPTALPYSQEIAQGVAASRRLSVTSVEFGSLWLKTIIFARVCEEDCWLLTDGARRCAEARRIDRETFPAIGALGERKSHSLPRMHFPTSLTERRSSLLILTAQGGRQVCDGLNKFNGQGGRL